ncbi:hypothetical protein GCM10008931_20380 [Oceanobacillus oncorhynchi subsp. oncorhynchi]|uniref:NAD-dependent epimerase/dehydratase family protein n=1 Tax=Oceanobacillus oncorhynchi TaxID=545501 RepID=UPI0031D29918
MKKVLVAGAGGVLGKLVCQELLRIMGKRIQLTVIDYKTERGEQLANALKQDVQFQFMDVDDKENVKQVIKNVDIVVVVVKQKTPHIQTECMENKILCIDVTPFYDFVEKVKELNQKAEKNEIGSVIMSGFFPGLSGLMVKETISYFQEVREVNVGLLQNTNAKTGLSGILDMLKIISQSVAFQDNIIPGFTKKKEMYFSKHNKEKEVRLIDHSERILLKNNLTAAPINYWTAWNSNSFNKMISMLKKFGLIKAIQKMNTKFLDKLVKHNPNKNEHAFLTVEVKGIVDKQECKRILSLSTFSDYHTTAMMTAALTKLTLEKEVEGIVCPFEITTLYELLSVMNCSELEIEKIENNIRIK